MATLPLARRSADAGYAEALFRYLLTAAQRPLNDWSAYRQPRFEAGNFGLRFQIAFHGYALAALAERLGAPAAEVGAALGALIDRFLQPEVWRYWLARGAALDPIFPHNIQYSGHLAQLIGIYERLTGDRRFDRPFLLDDAAASRHEYTHDGVVAAIARQMAANRCHGVTCEPGNVYVACNTHAALALLLYDAAHGTDHRPLVTAWNRWVRQRMVRRRGGIFQVAYLTERDFVIPLNVRVMDAWSMAFLSPVDPELFDSLYPRFRRELVWRGALARVPARWPNALLEIADEALNSAFAFVAAREAGDEEAAAGLWRYAQERLGLHERDGHAACWSTRYPLLVTALFALGEALAPRSMRAWGAPA
ncbi:MAG: hypothetical protein RMM58_10850 [Chloroflexota bacterium]|nr:hypothetical protein [Dehalococcoidia bacterium]MDW8254364.1 hypothetical protein [Chloroflexota bacterium]